MIGLIALIGVSWAVYRFGMKNTLRERFKEGIAATGAIREQLGRDCSVSVDGVEGDDEQVEVTVKFLHPPAEPAIRKEVVLATNVIVRRAVHHVKDTHVRFDDDDVVPPLPAWDGGTAFALAPPPEPPTAAPDAGTAPAKPKVKTGTVTLVTFPDADVFRGKDKLGRTPLFNAELPVGTHLLTLVGADGARHRLSMPVKLGKNKPMKMNLADLPAR
jgi:hypothetical protein